MTNARIERLTREALGPRKRDTPVYTRIDDDVLQGVIIVVLVVTIIVFAAWPREETGADTHAAAAAQSIDARAVSVSHASDRDPGTARKADNSPLY